MARHRVHAAEEEIAPTPELGIGIRLAQSFDGSMRVAVLDAEMAVLEMQPRAVHGLFYRHFKVDEVADHLRIAGLTSQIDAPTGTPAATGIDVVDQVVADHDV